MKRTPFKRKVQKSLRRTKLRLVGHSDTSVVKRAIQAILRQIAIKRDGGCVLARFSAQVGACDEILQAEHLNSRASSSTYADTRNIVCLCRRHHIYWKPQNSRLYWELIRSVIGEERWAWYILASEDKRPHHMCKGDWVMAQKALEQELQTYA